MKRVAIYIRVSTARQDQEGYSIPLQKERLIAYCKAKGWVVAGVFIDPGHSGSSLERPGIESLIEAVEAGKYDVVLVYKLDRLSRSQKDTLFLIEDVFMAHNTDFVSMQESFDTTTIYGRAMVGILSVFAQMERETITERTMMGRSGRAEGGLWHGGGTDPLGYDYVDGELVVNPVEAQQIREIYGLYADGYSVTEITRRMEGCTTKHGDWSHTSTVGNVLDNPLYAGIIHFDGVMEKGKHEAIVSDGLNKKVKDRRERLRRVEASGDSAHLLTGLIYCEHCHARYFPHRRPNGSVIYSCHSRAKKNRSMVRDPQCKAPHIPVAELDAMVEAEVMRLAENPALVDELVKKRAAMWGGSDTGSRSEEIKKLDTEIGRLMDLLQHDALVSVGEIADRISQAHAERMRIMPEKEADAPRNFDVNGFKIVLRDVAFSWDDANVRGRRAFLFQLIDGIHINAEGISIEWSL
ncbi:MAG: recombinase family protein [Faecousia sp.]